MAQLASSDSDDDFHSASQLPLASPDEDNDSDSILDMTPSVHPISSFQDAFEESIAEAAEDDTASLHLNDPDIECDAETRRRKLLEAERYEDVSATRWKQKPGAKHHPIVKLMAQIVFGMHLLQQEQAKSNEAVVKILQSHVNDVDNFLERTSDDFDLAITDIEERIRYLQLPMQHMAIFEVMLDEKKFRSDLLHGNEKIEKIIERTRNSMQDAMTDVESGIKCAKELHQYLRTIEKKEPMKDENIREIFSAMRGNQQGWMKVLSDLQTKGNNLEHQLATLQNVIVEIARLAAEASRRSKPVVQRKSPSTAQQTSQRASALQSKYTQGSQSYISHRTHDPRLDKPLPQAPGRSDDAKEAAVPTPHPVPFSARFEQPRLLAPIPGSRSTSSPLTRSPIPQRPRTSSSADPRTAGRNDAGDIEVFRKHSNPLRSHPPNHTVPILQAPPSKRAGYSQRQSSGNMLNSTTKKGSTFLSKRSKSSVNMAGSISPTISLLKKVTGAEQRKESTKINFVPRRAATETLPSTATGFSRRLSARRKHLPPPIRITPEPIQSIEKPVDSVYSSDRKRSTSSPTNFTTDTEQTEPDPAPEPEKGTPTIDRKKEFRKFGLARDSSQPGSRLALFPKVSTPTQSNAPSRNTTPLSKAKTSEAWLDNSEKPQPAMQQQDFPKSSRGFSMTKFFHRKGDSRIVSASG